MNYYNLYKKYINKYSKLKIQQKAGESSNLSKTCVANEIMLQDDSVFPPYSPEDCNDAIIPGRDDKRYISIGKKWEPFKEIYKTFSAEEYYSQFNETKPKYNIEPIIEKLKKIKKELEYNGIYLLNAGWKNVYESNEFATEKILKKLRTNPKIQRLLSMNDQDEVDIVPFIFYTDYNLFWSTINAQLILQLSLFEQDTEIVMDIFNKYFKNQFDWDGNPQSEIIINIINV